MLRLAHYLLDPWVQSENQYIYDFCNYGLQSNETTEDELFVLEACVEACKEQAIGGLYAKEEVLGTLDRWWGREYDKCKDLGVAKNADGGRVSRERKDILKKLIMAA